MKRLRGKTVKVTGAGIGEAGVIGMAEEGDGLGTILLKCSAACPLKIVGA